MHRAQILDCTIPANLNIFTLQDAEVNLTSAESEGGFNAQQLEALKSSLSDIKGIMECRQVLGREGPKGLLAALEAFKIKRQTSKMNPVVAHKKFKVLMDTVRQQSGSSASPNKNQAKLRKLAEVLVEHFKRHNKAGNSTRVLVFTQLRTTVHEIKTALKEAAPGIILPHEFVGQSTKTAADGSSANQVYIFMLLYMLTMLRC
jgi:ERCC4-related helicase